MKKNEHQTLYRKYRPKSFKDVLGQDHVVDVLKNSLDKGTLAHAYIFAGTRGTGKTSTARIFASELGTNETDLYEIDAASNRGIDEIRAIREAVTTFPFDSKYKVYIIDEAHMLTKDAWNAFLKTLEEPPAHVIFILATTELSKIPETILSRCEIYEFKKPSQELLSQVIQKTARSEGVSISKSGAELIALMADGSFRDAHGFLQKAISFSAKDEITEELISSITGAPRPVLVQNMLSAIAEGNIERALEIANAISKQTVDVPVFMKLLLEKFRMALFIKISAERKRELEKSLQKDEFEFLEGISKESKTINAETLRKLLKAYDELFQSQFPELTLELSLLGIVGE